MKECVMVRRFLENRFIRKIFNNATLLFKTNRILNNDKTFSLLLSRAAALILIIILFSNLAVPPAYGQEPVGLGEVRPLKIGDTIPEVLWDLPLQVVNHPEGKEVITLSDYRDKKLIILDFWATWCGTCIESLKKIKSLRTDYGNDVVFLPITSEGKSEILNSRAIKRNSFLLNEFTVYADSTLKSLFPHQSLPHVVWIDNKGTVRKTSLSFFVSNVYLDAILLNDDYDNIASKEEWLKPADIQEIFQTKTQHPIVMQQLKGAKRQTNIRDLIAEQPDYFYYINYPLLHLYYIAYGEALSFFNSHVVIEDSRYVDEYIPSQRDALFAWNQKHAYCYADLTDNLIREPGVNIRMRNALDSFFGIQSMMRTEIKTCLIVKGIAEQASLPEVGYNQFVSLGQTIRQLNGNTKNIIILDESSEERRLKVWHYPTEIHDSISLLQYLKDLGWEVTLENRTVKQLYLTKLGGQL